MTGRWMWHGGGLRAAQAHFGGDPQAWLDLSTGINSHAWPIPPLDIDWARLPDEQHLRGLEATAAAHFGVDPACVCALPGTELGLRLLGPLLPGPARHVTPGYRTHAEMWPVGAPVSIDALADADGQTLILANPGNPDGRVTARAALLEMLDRRGSDGWLLIDEAFADVDPTISLTDCIAADRRLLIFRSFGKFFGLAGVRLGFLLGPPSVLDRIRHLLGAWPLPDSTIRIGIAAYADRDWIDAMRGRLHTEAAMLDARLAALGYRVTGACPLFRLLHVDDAPALFTRLARRTILTRPFADDPHGLRIGLPANADALARLEAALRDG